MPVRWTDYAAKTAPFSIEPGYFKKIDHLLDQALYFELNNEPHDKFMENEWNAILVKGHAAVRETNSTHDVIIWPPYYTASGRLLSSNYLKTRTSS